jgi:hypothetical protein
MAGHPDGMLLPTLNFLHDGICHATSARAGAISILSRRRG